MNLPLNLPDSQMETKWKSILDPILQNPLNSVNILTNIQLVNGKNTINHLLGRVQQGWFLTDIQGAATIYRLSPFNNLTLVLMSNAEVVCNIGVF
jgi:hypothetical protein